MLLLALTYAAVVLSQGAAAAPGAGGHVFGCVRISQQPDEPINFTFTPGSANDRNMRPTGREGSVIVSEAGVFCADLDYVGEIPGTWQTSIWTLSYKGGNYSGSASSEWSPSLWDNEVILKNPSPETSVCGSTSMCNRKQFRWERGTTGPIFFLFTPGATVDVDENSQIQGIGNM